VQIKSKNGGVFYMKPNKVNEPKYQLMKDIAKDYWGNWLLISNFTEKPSGGTVRYFYPTRVKTLTDLIMEMDRDSDLYGDCVLTFVGGGDSLGGIGL
jgi:hypothetical protein